MIRIVCFFSLLLSSVVRADSLTELPELADPLSLSQALEMANDFQYYQMIEAEALITDARSQVLQAESALGFKAQLDIEAAYIDPSPLALDQSSNDSSVTLRLIKPLYDFGGSNEKIQAAQTEQAALEEHMSYIIAQRKIDIARQFFDVLLADLKYAWDNETLATAYVRFDANKDRHNLKQLSDLELLESENFYLETLHTRSLSEINQRYTRAMLAELLNRPGQLPSNLQMPTLKPLTQKLPEYQVLVDNVLQNNPQIKLAEKNLQVASQRLSAEKDQLKPQLNAQIEVAEYARNTGSSDDFRAQLNLLIPLYENSSIKKDIAKARAVWLKQQAQLLATRMEVRKQALSLWQTISVLSARSQQLLTSRDFRELNLDKSRALYEMEVKTDLGYSMVAISEIQYKQAKNSFALALAQMQLALLTGELDIIHAALETGENQ